MSELPFSTSNIDQEVKVRLGEEGQEAIPPKTVMQLFDVIVERLGDHQALFQKRPAPGQDVKNTPWTSWTWNEYRGQVDAFGKALISLGCERFDIINIIGFNAPEWFFSNFGAMAAGLVSAGIYTTNNSTACKYISEHSKAKVVVCEGIKQLEKYYKISKELPHLKALVMYGPDQLPSDITSKCSVPVYSFEDFINLGKDITDAQLRDRTNAWKPGEACTLIYTSGTTGPPKAVMITNDNITWTIRTILRCTRRGFMDETDVMISYLPLSHIAAQMIDMLAPIEAGFKVYFAQPDALKGSLGATLKDVRPTIFFGVPRVYEKIYEKLQEVAKSTTGVKKILSGWAKSEVILSKVHEALGFDRCYGFYVSAAPIDVKILKYFASLDIPIMELFGQSECSGPHAINLYTAYKMGTVGRPLPGTETKLDENSGELCYRGRHIFAGYLGMPQQTNDTIDSEGWLHSGDIASIDDNEDPQIRGRSGFIKITGRIKELIITAGGENIPPVLIEDELKAAMPALSNAMVIGDKRKFLSVLFCLKVEIDEDGIPTNKLTGTALETAKAINSDATTMDEAMNDPSWHAYFDNGIQVANKKAASRAQKVGKWTLLRSDFSEKGGELTPTLKLKRAVTASKYAKEIEAMYAHS